MVTARGLARVAVSALGLVLALALALSGALFVTLSKGPVDLESLKPSLARSLEERLGAGYHVSIASTFLTGGPRGIGVGFGDFEIRDSAGRTVVSAPGGRVGLDALALLSTQVKVRRLELDGLTVALRVRQDGGLSIAGTHAKDAASLELMPPRSAGAAPGADVPTIVGALIEVLAGSSQALDRVTLDNGRLEVENQALVKTSVYQDLAVAFEKDGDAAKFAASARGPSGSWTIGATARVGTERFLEFEARNLGLSDLLLLDPERPPFDFDMPISFKIDAALGAGEQIQSLTAHFGLGAGYFKLADPDAEPFLIDEATGSLVWDAAARQYRIEKVEALAGASRFRIQGWAAPPLAGEDAWRAHLETGDSVLAGERPGEQPVAIDRADLDAHYEAALSKLTIDRFALHGPRLKGDLSAEFTADEHGPRLKVDMRLGSSGLADALRLWPSFINPDAHNWCLEHFRGGELASGSMKLDWDAAALDALAHKRSVPADSVRGDFAFKDAAVDVLPGLPTLTGLDATGFITGRVFSVIAKRGAMEFSQGRRMLANDLYFKVPDTAPAAVVPSQAGAHVQGSADSLAELLSRDAIKRYAGFTLDPATVKGQFQGQLTMDIGLGRSVRPEDQRFKAEGTLANLQLDKFMNNVRFEQGALDITAESGSLKITGQGVINALPTKVELAKGAADEGGITLNLTLDDAARARLGLAGGPTMTGPMAVKVKAPLNKSGADFEVDLTRVEIGTPESGILKSAGKPGKVTFSTKSAGDAIAISGLALDAGSMTARGSAQFGADGALQNAKFTQLRLNAQDDLKIDVQGGSTLKATVRGASFDAKGLMKSLLGRDSKAGASAERDADIDMKVGAVSGSNRETITGFDLVASRRGGVLKALTIAGRLGGGAFTAHKDETGVLTVRAADAGALAKFLDVYTKMEGGSLDLNLHDGAQGSRGVASVRNFVLRDEPALRQLAAASPAATTARGESAVMGAVDSSGVKFDRLSAEFTRSAGRLEVRDASISNAEVGLTTQGFIDYTRDRVDLYGTFVPAYQLNNFVTKIPVFGLLLGGGTHEGIFAVNYRLTGPATEPRLTINPLSGMAPGILRKIFGAVDGTTPAPDAYAPEP